MRVSRFPCVRRRRVDREAGYGAGYGSEYGFEWLTIRDSRDWVCRQASGRTLELGVGTGLNLKWYPREVELFGVDLERERLDVSAERAHELGQAVRLVLADGHQLPFSSDTFDAVVCTLAICDVKYREAVLSEVFRVLRPAGSLLMLDHLERRWRDGRPATIGERVGFRLERRQRLWAGYFERARLHKPGA